MLYFFTPYGSDGNLGRAYNRYFDIVPYDDDWVCICDGDVMFLDTDFGKIIEDAIRKHPKTGIFTCLTNRVKNKEQCFTGKMSNDPDIRFHRDICAKLKTLHAGRFTELTRHIGGMIMVIKKATWKKFPFMKGLLGIDYDFSSRVLASGLKILRIDALYVFHYYRLNEGSRSKAHLNTLSTVPATAPLINVLIRTSQRPRHFARAYASVMAQTYKKIQVIATVDTIGTKKYAHKYPIQVLRVHKQPVKFHYNTYLQVLFNAVAEGWLFILDDDDFLTNPVFFESIMKQVTNKDTLVTWKMRWSDGHVIPEPEYFRLPPVAKHIGMPCFMFHSKYKHVFSFDNQRRADFRLYQALWKAVPKKLFVDEVFVQIGNTGAMGSRIEVPGEEIGTEIVE